MSSLIFPVSLVTNSVGIMIDSRIMMALNKLRYRYVFNIKRRQSSHYFSSAPRSILSPRSGFKSDHEFQLWNLSHLSSNSGIQNRNLSALLIRSPRQRIHMNSTLKGLKIKAKLMRNNREHYALSKVIIALVMVVIVVAAVGAYSFSVRGLTAGSNNPTETSSTVSQATSVPQSLSTSVATTSKSTGIVVDIVSGAHSQSQEQHFVPQTITVEVGVNNTITWMNQDSAPHTVTANSNSFNSGTIVPGSNFTMTFTTPGTYQYHCNIHPFMTGTVIVLNANGQAVSQSASSTVSSNSATTVTSSNVRSSCSYYYAGLCY